HAPPFANRANVHFRPAFKVALEEHNQEIDASVNGSPDPSVENTIVALENAGSLLGNVSRVAFNRTSARANDSIQAIAKDLAPVLSAHGDEISLNEKLFARVKKVYDDRTDLALDGEDTKL